MAARLARFWDLGGWMVLLAAAGPAMCSGVPGGRRPVTSRTAIRFAASVNYQVGGNLISLVPGDFNADGRMDLAVARYGSGGVVLLMNRGNAVFSRVEAEPYRWIGSDQIAATDLNDDGKLDLALNDALGSVRVYIGRGDGGFEPAQVFPVKDEPIRLAIGDLNDDGKPDLVLPNGYGKNSISILLGRGAASFAAPQHQPMGFDTRSVVLGDFDSDGKLDLAAVDWVGNQICLLRGTGNGRFVPLGHLATADSPACVTVADLNGDGKLDLVTANQDSDSVSVFLGRGDGTFQSRKDFPAGNLPLSVVAADLNGDHCPDLIVTHDQGQELSILPGNGDGTFAAPLRVKVGFGVRSVAIADFNRDGLPDLATANYLDGTVSVLLNATGGAPDEPALSAPLSCQLPSPVPATPTTELAPTRQIAAKEDYHIDAWTTDEGLPENTVQCILQTHDGYLWIGTQSGLARFDGFHFTIFDRSNTPALTSDNILCLAEGADYTLWIGTSQGFVRLRNHLFTRFGTTVANVSLGHVWTLSPDYEGGVWAGAEGYLVHLSKERVVVQTNFVVDIRSLLEERDGTLWVASDAELSRYGPNAKVGSKVYVSLGHTQAGGANGLYLDHQGNLWFGNAAGLWRWRDGRLKVYRPKHGVTPGIASSIVEDRQGALWFTTGSTLNRFRNGQFTVFDTRVGLPDCEMHCVYPDREGNIWAGTSRAGLVRLRAARPLLTMTKEQGLVDNDVWSICEARNGDMWFGTPHGVSRFAVDHFTNYPSWDQPVFEDRSGKVWVAANHTLNLIDRGTLRAFTPKGRNLFGHIRSLYEDSSGAVWVACDQGLWRLKGAHCELYALSNHSIPITHWEEEAPHRTFTVHTNAFPGLSSPVGTLEDYAGNLWIGSTGGGLHCLRNGQFTTLTTTNGLTSDFTGPLLADPDGTLWVGSDKGLNRLKDGRITRYTTTNGLAENIVGNLLEDDQGWFWTMGYHGIHRMRKQALIDLAEGKRDSIQTITYGARDGLLSTEVNVGEFPNACETSDGLLWFPTTCGVVVVEPHLLQTRDHPPPVVLEQVLANDKIIFGDGVAPEVSRRLNSAAPTQAEASPGFPKPRLKLPPGGARVLQFFYTANTFFAPDQVRFEYQLVGHDLAWRNAGLRRSVTYTDIAPGTYTFRVVAINSHGAESETPAELLFSLAPYFYQTPWFYAASTLTALLLFLGLHRLRVSILSRHQALKQQLALAHQRERIAKDMHDDLGASLTQIGLLGEHARRDPHKSPSVAVDVEKIVEAARQSAQAAEEIVWTVNPRHDTLDSLATYLCQFAGEYLAPTGVRCRLDVPGLLPDVHVPSEVRHNVVLLVKEALNNAVKHAAARQVTVALRLEEATLTLTVSDDGRGFDPQNHQPLTLTRESPSHGNGLANMRQRVEAIGGRFELRSRLGQGTQVKATVRLGA